MKKNILLIIILLLIFTGCKKKSDCKYINKSNNINILISLDKDNKEHYILNKGFINGRDSKIVVKDNNDNIIDISNNTDIYSMRNINSNHKYFKIYTSPITMDISNTYYKKKNIKYNAKINVQIVDVTKILSNKYRYSIDIDTYYNDYIKSILDKNINNAIKRVLKKEKELSNISVTDLNQEFNKISSKQLDKYGISINIETIEFIDK